MEKLVMDFKKTGTRLSAKLVLIDPETAKDYLKFNPKNRPIRKANLAKLSREMLNGRFMENGESIVFDKNGELKDGQHRLLSIISTGKSYHIPVVWGVEPDSMATYDTGQNRTAADVLYLNGYKNACNIAALITSINKWDSEKYKPKSKYSNSKNANTSMSNAQVLEYCRQHYDWLRDIQLGANNALQYQKPKVFTATELGLIIYLIGGRRPSRDVYSFINHIVGKSREIGTAPNYIYTKVYNSKLKKEPLNFHWVLGMIIKAWNYYIDGNPSVKYYKFSIDSDLPIPTVIKE